MDTKELALELENVILKIEEHFYKTSKESERIGSMRQDILHHMENEQFNASEGYKYSKALQLISKERRLIKNELSLIQKLHDKIKPYKNNINTSVKQVMDKYAINELNMERGYESYVPRVIPSLNKKDVLNQVIEILNEK